MKGLVVVGLLILGLGCDVGEREGGLADMTFRELGQFASRIMEDPSVADSVLMEAGVDVATLDSLMYAVASDAQATAEYLEGLGR